MDGLTLAGTLELECEASVALFYFEEKFEKPLCQAHQRALQHQLETEKKMNLLLGENQEDVHLKHGRRSAPQSAQKCVSLRQASLLVSVQRKNLEDQKRSLHHQELECRCCSRVRCNEE